MEGLAINEEVVTWALERREPRFGRIRGVNRFWILVGISVYDGPSRKSWSR